MKICTRCKKKKEEACFGHKRGKLSPHCRECQSKYWKAWYSKEENKKQKRKSVRLGKQTMKNWYHSLKAKPCFDCGVKYPHYVMQFDHVVGKKKWDISRMWFAKSKKTIEEEIKKCELVCANCHAIRTYERKHVNDGV